MDFGVTKCSSHVGGRVLGAAGQGFTALPFAGSSSCLLTPAPGERLLRRLCRHCRREGVHAATDPCSLGTRVWSAYPWHLEGQ